MADTFTCILYHIVFSTKNRRALITPEIQERLYEYMGGIIRKRGGSLYEIGGVANHVHLLIRWNTSSLSDLIRDLKSESTKWVRSEFAGHGTFQWQSGAGIFSISHSHIDPVKNYVRAQEQHHKLVSYEDEFLKILEKHELLDQKREPFG